MPVERINVTLGTAGHIDHGKTALVKLLTGCETDRLKAEKERGMSIDLGFAPCKLADREIGFVDVPGHENFIKTMVAGASGMDGVVLVVAADDGVMPQTREHLEILTLLGVRHGLVAMTKIDRVDPEHIELARGDIEDLLRGTFLEFAPVCPLSNVTGEGFDGFFEALLELVDSIEPKQIDGVFRMPIDRAFSVKGHGTVVAGIPVSGAARIDEEVVLLPSGVSGRIRGIEVYGHTSDTVVAGQCAALNMRRWEHHSITRGDTLTLPGYFSPQPWFACTLTVLPREKLVLKSGANVNFHTGTSKVPATVYPMKGDRLRPGDECFVQIRAKAPVVAAPGDRYILRTLSPVQTVGGGVVVEAISRRLKRNRPEVHDALRDRAKAIPDEVQFVEYCLRTARSLALSQAEIASNAKVLRSRVEQIVEDLTRSKKIILLASNLYIHTDSAAEASRRILDIVATFHRRSPESPGIGLEQLRGAAAMDRVVLRGLIGPLKDAGKLVEQNGRLATAKHRVVFSEEDAGDLEAIEALFREHEFSPPDVKEIAHKTGVKPKTVERLLGILRENQRLVAIGEGLLFHREALDHAKQIMIEFITKEGKLESVRFKYLLNTTRKFAIPLLDHLDRLGIFRRVGNTRYLKTPPGGNANA